MFRTITLSVLLLGGLTACGNGDSTTAPSPTPSPTPTPTGPTVSVSIVQGGSTLTTTAFSPNPLTVNVGTTVTWTNNDVMAHTSTADGGLWNSGTLPPGGRYSYTFQAAGNFPYHCALHPGMVGTVTVR